MSYPVEESAYGEVGQPAGAEHGASKGPVNPPVTLPTSSGGRCGFTMLFTEKAVHLLKTSILLTDFSKVYHTPWNTTTCQDILHSVYKLRKSLENNLDVYGGRANGRDNINKIEMLIRNVLRPFAVEWHGHLFENEDAKGGELRTVARKRMARRHRKAFRSNVLDIQETAIRMIEDLDPEWEYE